MNASAKPKSYEIDMCSGPLLGKMLLFSIPLMFSGILQLLFNAADMIVVGRFAGSSALAAVGATSSLINLLINVFIGLSIGSNVLVAHYRGAGQDKDVNDTVHTAIATSLISSIFLGVLGFCISNPLLRLMGTPEDVLVQSTLYMRIYFIGIPALLLYNFGSSILRAVGDTKRPLYYLVIAGVVNVCLNLFFVIVLHMGVAGVALATILSQCVSAGLIVKCLLGLTDSCRLELSKLHIYADKLKRIMKIGLPAGFQGALFSISNVLIQSSINSFGPIAMAGNAAAVNLEGFIYTAMNTFHQTALNFTSQNMGARKYGRIKKVLLLCLILVCAVGALMGYTGLYIGNDLLRIYSSDAEVISFGMLRMKIIFSTYFACGLMDVAVGSIRGMGYSVLPMIVSLLGACGLRILWIYTVFAQHRTLSVLYISYPVTWTITFCVHLVCFILIFGRTKKRYPADIQSNK